MKLKNYSLGGSMYYLGVDGGGSKTAFCLINKYNYKIIELEKKTCHYAQIGMLGFKTIIEEGISEILEKVSSQKDEVEYAFLGIPGYGEDSEKNKEIKEILDIIFPEFNYSIGNDAEASWAGSLACKPGISIVAGTGTIAYGKNSDNETVRSGGWGEFCGDEGSAYWIAKKGIEIFSKQADFRYERGALYDIFTSKLNLNNDFDLLNIVTIEYKKSRTKIAKLSKLVYEAAMSGDKYAIEIFFKAANECFLMIQGVINQLSFSESEILISYSGGVFNSGDLILKPLEKIINSQKRKIKLIKPILSPVVGAGLYAMVLSGENIDENIINRLKKNKK